MSSDARHDLTLTYAVGVLLPVSYGAKLIWNLPVPFVEPAFVLVLWLWWTRRHVARLTVLELALALGFLVSAAAAVRHETLPPARWLDAWSHSARTIALLLTIAWARSLDEEHRVRLAHGFFHGLSAALGFSVVLALIGLHLLPNLLAVDLDYVDYDSRFSLHLGPIPLPRLIGLCVEPAPFGALGVAALVIARHLPTSAEEQARASARVGWTALVGSMSDQALLGGLWLLAEKRRRRGSPLSWFLAFSTAAAVLPYLVDRIAAKAGEFLSLADDPLLFEQVWGSSGGERIVNSILALGLATDSLANFAIGIGPSLYGIFASELFPVLDDRHQVQVLPADLLCSVGVIGTGLVLANAIAWWRRAESSGAFASLLALLLSNFFQSDFKSPALGVAIGLSIAGASTHLRREGSAA